MNAWLQIAIPVGTVIGSGVSAWVAIWLRSKKADEEHRRQETRDRTEFRASLLDRIARQDERINDLTRDVLACEWHKVAMQAEINELKLRLGEPIDKVPAAPTTKPVAVTSRREGT